jgi:thiol:disulfide interchange protein
MQEGVAKPLAVFEREFVIGVAVDLANDVRPGPLSIPARLRFQACDDKVCYPPRTVALTWSLEIAAAGAPPAAPAHAEVFAAINFGSGGPNPATAPPPPASGRSGGAAGPTAADDDIDPIARLDRFAQRGTTLGGYAAPEAFLEFVKDAEAGVTSNSWFAGRGVIAILAMTFVGGLALNLTPCVLPMIPINLAIIGAGSQAGGRRRGFLLGAAYGGAMAIIYGLLGLVVILTAGTFGTINSSPWFNLGIALLFVVLALAMFDVISIDFSRLSSRIRFAESSRGTFLLAFGMGTIAALLAGACVAPVVIQVVLFASDLYAKGTAPALALPFVLGLGMALPWPVAGAGMASLPRPGAWMVRVKQAMGVFILATAAYYGYLAYGIFANRWVDPASVTASVKAQLEDGWYASLGEGLAAAEREAKPVLIDMWATWCKNCLVMDETTLKDPAVQKAIADYVKIKVQSEDLDASPAKDLLERYNGFGLPSYIILEPRQVGGR